MNKRLTDEVDRDQLAEVSFDKGVREETGQQTGVAEDHPKSRQLNRQLKTI